MSPPVRVLVVGAQGVLGAAVAVALRDSGFEVLRGGRRAEAAGDFVRVDLDNPETLVSASRDMDLVVNCVLHEQLAPQRTILQSGGAMLDISSVSLEQRRALEAEAGSGRGLVVVHAGLNPGLTTVVMKEMLDAHPEADELELVNTLSARQAAGGNSFAFFHRSLTAFAHLPTAVLPLPPPLGPSRCLQLDGGEEGWLAELAAGRRGRVYIRLEPLPTLGLRVVNALRLRRALPRFVLKLPALLVKPPPRGIDGLSREQKCDWLAVLKGGRRQAARTVEGEGDYKMTVDATVIFCAALAEYRRAKPDRTGVVGAESLFSLRDLQPGFEARGITIRNQPV